MSKSHTLHKLIHTYIYVYMAAVMGITILLLWKIQIVQINKTKTVLTENCKVEWSEHFLMNSLLRGSYKV